MCRNITCWFYPGNLFFRISYFSHNVMKSLFFESLIYLYCRRLLLPRNQGNQGKSESESEIRNQGKSEKIWPKKGPCSLCLRMSLLNFSAFMYRRSRMWALSEWILQYYVLAFVSKFLFVQNMNKIGQNESKNGVFFRKSFRCNFFLFFTWLLAKAA